MLKSKFMIGGDNMNFFIVEKEKNIEQRFWKQEELIYCLNMKKAKREMYAMIKMIMAKSTEEEFLIKEIKDESLAISKSGMIRVKIYPINIIDY